VIVLGNAQNVELRNNIIWAQGLNPPLCFSRTTGAPFAGVARVSAGLDVPLDGSIGLASDYNLFYVPIASYVGSWLGTQAFSLQSWQIISGRDSNSLVGNPAFVDFDGADNILGGSSGADDDFHLQSPFG